MSGPALSSVTCGQQKTEPFREDVPAFQVSKEKVRPPFDAMVPPLGIYPNDTN